MVSSCGINFVGLLPILGLLVGFAHTAFTFAYESLVIKSSAAQTEIPPGALITFLQKGLEYIAIEEHIAEVLMRFPTTAVFLVVFYRMAQSKNSKTTIHC
jgi:hypothetical protein